MLQESEIDLKKKTYKQAKTSIDWATKSTSHFESCSFMNSMLMPVGMNNGRSTRICTKFLRMCDLFDRVLVDLISNCEFSNFLAKLHFVANII
jgi:hypothetical protein